METMFPQPSPQPDAARLFDKHTIDTPEQLQLDFAVAGIGSRFLAVLIDSLIQGVATLLVGLGLAVLAPLLRAQVGGTWFAGGMLAFFFLLYYGYYAFFEIIWNGQTPGKRIIHIRVVKDSGRPLTATETIGRNLMRIVDQLPGFYAIGILVAVLNSRNKRLGDLVAGSLVVRESSLTDLKPIWQAAHAGSTSMIGANMLSVDDLALIDAFLNRRHELAPEVRSRMAMQIFNQVRPRLPEMIQPGSSVEAMLESLAWERRSAGQS
jgi:uncharacterized RDD family membrane protein YckC